MVCREDKGRSAMMGYFKLIQSSTGHGSFHDSDMQSRIHEDRHRFDSLVKDFDNMSIEDQIRHMEAFKRQVANDDRISESDKYRPDRRGPGSRPGVITRLDQEIERLRSGVDESGRPLTQAQKNDTSHMLAMMYMGDNTEHIVPARNQILENYARSTGKSMDEAREEWKELMNDKGDFSNLSGVPENFREQMNRAGLTTDQQIAISQSGRQLRALSVLDSRRNAHLDSLRVAGQSRDFLDDETPGETLQFTGGRGYMKCEICGLFGHEAPNCRAEKLVEKRERIQAGSDQIANIERYWEARDKLDGTVARYDKEEWEALTNEVAHFEKKIGRKPERPDAERERIDTALADIDKEIQKEARTAEDMSDDVFDDDDAIRVKYDRESGVVIREPVDQSEPLQAYRIPPEKWDEFQVQGFRRQDGFAGAWDSVIAGNTDHHFDNSEEVQNSMEQFRCPNCGRWASLTTNHQCVVEGGPSEEQAAELARVRMSSRGGGIRLAPRDLNSIAPAKSALIKYPDKNGNPTEAMVRFGEHTKPASVIETARDGGVVMTSTQINFQDGTVTGNYAVWANPSDRNQTVMDFQPNEATKGLKCSCPEYQRNYRCQHTRLAINQLAARYSRASGQDVVNGANAAYPGGRPDGQVFDSENIRPRRTYAALEKELNAHQAAQVAKFESHRGTGPDTPMALVGTEATDADGRTIGAPRTWTWSSSMKGSNVRPNKEIDLQDTEAVKTQIQQSLRSHTPEGYEAKKDRRAFAVKADDDGVIRVRLTSGQASGNGGKTKEEYAEQLASHFGVPTSMLLKGRQEIVIAPDTASRHEALDRAHTRTPLVYGARPSIPTDGSMEYARIQAVVGTSARQTPQQEAEHAARTEHLEYRQSLRAEAEAKMAENDALGKKNTPKLAERDRQRAEAKAQRKAERDANREAKRKA